MLSAPRPGYTGTIAEGVGVRKVLEQLEQAHGGSIELPGGENSDPPVGRPVGVGQPAGADDPKDGGR